MSLKAKAEEYILKFPKYSSTEIARTLKKDFPESFETVETARQVVRYALGARGDASRRRKSPNISSRTPEEINLAMARKWPEPEPSKFKVHYLSEGYKYLITSDYQIPYHDPVALEIAISYGIKQKCDGHIILGDLNDFCRISKFNRDLFSRNTVEELETTKQIRKILDSVGYKKKLFKLGNHDMRLDDYLIHRAPELYGLPNLNLESILELKENGWDWVYYNSPVYYKDLTLLHGHEFGGGWFNPVNQARSAFLKSYSCVLVAHGHQTSEHPAKTLRGTIITSWSIGCMCNLNPEWKPFNQWNLGFAILDTTEKKWTVSNKRVINGEVL